MDRGLVYPTQIPLAPQALKGEVRKMIALGQLAQAIFGTATVADGLACAATSPTADMHLTIGAGSMYTVANVDASSFGEAGSDTAHNILKQGINLDATQLTFTAPGSVGQAINYLIQGQIAETDTDSTVLKYYNAGNPAVPFDGPANSNTSQPTTRKCVITINAKAGTAATSGSQVTPSADAGYVPLYVVTVAYGATQLTASEFSQHPSSPFLYKKLPELPLWIQRGDAIYGGTDTGSANAVVVNLTPTPSAIPRLMVVKKSANANTGNVTINVNGLGAVSLLDSTGSQLGSGNLPASCLMLIAFDGTACRLINGQITQTTVSSLTGTSGEGITVAGSSPYAVSLNFPGLSAGSPTALDIFAFYSQASTAHRGIQWADLLTILGSGLAGLIGVQAFTAAGAFTYTKTTGARRILAFGTGGGGGGGQGNGNNCGAGAGAGATALAAVDVSSIPSISGSVGAGGAANGGAGGTTTLGAVLSAGGGPGGANNVVAGQGAQGGVATVGALKLPGGPGNGPMNTTTGQGQMGGNGGPSFWGGAGRGEDGVALTTAGEAGQAPGAGGGGGKGHNGGAGAPGCVLILEFA